MQDFPFGTYSTDRLKLLHARTLARGVQHGARRRPLDPTPDEAVTLLCTTGADVDVVALDLLSDDGTERHAFVPRRRRWDNLAWGYLTEWALTLPPRADSFLLDYRVVATLRDGSRRWADGPDPQRVIEEALVSETARPEERRGRATSFALPVDRIDPPSWARSALVYQIFVDRFARPDGWPEGLALDEIHGGTLAGVEERLDYIVSLGATCLWLTPIFPSVSHHGYDGTDYHRVASRLGGEAALHSLVTAAHQRGLRLLLDLACNHVGAGHPYFQEALQAPESPYRDWFFFDPEGPPPGYRAFFGVPDLPELNTDHPGVRDYLLDVAGMWLRDFDVDGFRLDYASGPSLAFWAHFRRHIRQIKPDAWCFGEVVDSPRIQRRFTGYLDGVLDFHLMDALRRLLAYESRGFPWFEQFVRNHTHYFPGQDRLHRPLFLDNHDMDRFLTAAGGRRDALVLGALFAYTLPNPLILYYGTEIGLSQPARREESGQGMEISRVPMRWEETQQDGALLDLFRRLGRLRQDRPAMRAEQRETLVVAPDHLLLRLEQEGDRLLLAVNRGRTPVTLDHGTLQGGFTDLLTDEPLALDGHLSLAAGQGRLLAST